MNAQDRFELHYALLKEKYPNLAEIVGSSSNLNWKQVPTYSNTIELVNENYNPPVFLFGNQPVESYLRHWVSTVLEPNIDAIIIFGLGMGYPWLLLKDWLHANQDRELIIIEDDPELLTFALYSPFFEEILNDKQTEILFFDNKEGPEKYELLNTVIHKCLYQFNKISALPSYQLIKQDVFFKIKNYIDQRLDDIYTRFAENIGLIPTYYVNFWENYSLLRKSHPYSLLKDELKDIPAIIVGAGPSLEKNIEQLRNLSNKALIIAGGTSVNILNANGIDPHLTSGFDPFETFVTRTTQWTSFEKPLLYSLRINHEAVKSLNNPLIFVNEGNGIPLERNLASLFGLDYLSCDHGTSVINSDFRMANFLGCKPLILVGVDLAYSKNKAYGPGLKKDAHNPAVFRTSHNDDFVSSKDIYGEPIKTLSKWIMESYWYSEFKINHPETSIINATEGGIGFPGISNDTLKNVSEEFLTRSYDIEGMLHAAIQKASMPKILTNEELLTFKNDSYESLLRLEKLVSQLIEKYPDLDNIYTLSEFLDDSENYKKIDKSDAIDLMQNIEDEIAWKNLIGFMAGVYISLVTLLGKDRWKKSRILKKTGTYLHFIKDVIKLHLRVMQLDRSDITPLKQFDIKSEPRISVGNSNFFDNDNNLLSSANMVKGLQEGFAKRWYLSGALFAELNYEKGRYQGKQIYYYEDGTVKSEYYYEKGWLDKENILYWPNGKIRKKIAFDKGIREGLDEQWNEAGTLISQANYHEDKPVGPALKWDAQGRQFQKYVYDNKGELVNSSEPAKDLYLQKTAKHTETLTTTLDSLLSNLEKTTLTITDGQKGNDRAGNGIEEDILRLKKEMENLKSLSSELLTISNQEDLETNNSHIPNIEKTVKGELAELNHMMKNLLENIDMNVKDLKKNLKKDEKQ